METRKSSSVLGRRAFALLLACAFVLALAPVAATADDGDGGMFVVSPRGSDSNSCTAWAPCATIGHAVSLAADGDTVVVRRGTYTEDVTILVGLTLRGVGNPTIDAAGLDNAIVVTGAGATVEGFTVENATFEGILVRNTHGVTIRNNVVKANDQGIFLPPD